jgi:hypothetical protein
MSRANSWYCLFVGDCSGGRLGPSGESGVGGLKKKEGAGQGSGGLLFQGH